MKRTRGSTRTIGPGTRAENASSVRAITTLRDIERTQVMSRRSAPRREVVSIERFGRHGQVRYRHFLACGHVQIRKRVAPAGTVGCTDCESPDWSATDELTVQLIRAKVATHLRAPLDAVDVISSTSGVQGVRVWLDRDTLRRLGLDPGP